MASSAARPLQDQKALVTGGSSGIGAASARALARAGAAVGVGAGLFRRGHRRDDGVGGSRIGAQPELRTRMGDQRPPHLLVRRDALERWYDFSNKSEEAALRKWCAENGIELSGT
jgi:NAD(P)-dependent dehydrogenase (short-subunit alcohol dehydrogenase family)